MTQAPARERRAVAVRGIVQGVEFRPFIYALALRHGLAGSVCNDAEGVRIDVEGAPDALEIFLRGIKAEAPPLAVVEAVSWRPLAARGERGFRIEESRAGAQRRALISPDVATCAECLAELFDPADRRYRYPFTNCGPRFTITRAVPYDRAVITMAAFTTCAACQREYDNPLDRRFHAQPNACPVCGPRVQLLDRTGRALDTGREDGTKDPLRGPRGCCATGPSWPSRAWAAITWPATPSTRQRSARCAAARCARISPLRWGPSGAGGSWRAASRGASPGGGATWSMRPYPAARPPFGSPGAWRWRA